MIRRYQRAGAVASLTVLACITLIVFGFLHGVYLFVFGFGLFGLLGDAIHSLRRAGSAEVAILDGEDDAELGIVEVVIRDHGRLIGVDRGVVWTCDNLLHFRGTACYFALDGTDFTFRWARLSAVLVPVAAPTITVTFNRLRLPRRITEASFAQVMTRASNLVFLHAVSSEPRRFPPMVRPPKSL